MILRWCELPVFDCPPGISVEVVDFPPSKICDCRYIIVESSGYPAFTNKRVFIIPRWNKTWEYHSARMTSCLITFLLEQSVDSHPSTTKLDTFILLFQWDLPSWIFESDSRWLSYPRMSLPAVVDYKWNLPSYRSEVKFTSSCRSSMKFRYSCYSSVKFRYSYHSWMRFPSSCWHPVWNLPDVVRSRRLSA